MTHIGDLHHRDPFNFNKKMTYIDDLRHQALSILLKIDSHLCLPSSNRCKFNNDSHWWLASSKMLSISIREWLTFVACVIKNLSISIRGWILTLVAPPFGAMFPPLLRARRFATSTIPGDDFACKPRPNGSLSHCAGAGLDRPAFPFIFNYLVLICDCTLQIQTPDPDITPALHDWWCKA